MENKTGKKGSDGLAGIVEKIAKHAPKVAAGLGVAAVLGTWTIYPLIQGYMDKHSKTNHFDQVIKVGAMSYYPLVVIGGIGSMISGRASDGDAAGIAVMPFYMVPSVVCYSIGQLLP